MNAKTSGKKRTGYGVNKSLLVTGEFTKAKGVIPNLLYDILRVKRPTKEWAFGVGWAVEFLKAQGIPVVMDSHGNLTHGNTKNPTICFTCHTDTVHRDLGINGLVSNGQYVKTAQPDVLGGDDGAGMYILINMIKAGVPGLYVFFAQEESGGVGSRNYKMSKNVTRVISFDRMGTDHLITHQMGERGVSEEFEEYFLRTFPLPFVSDPTGSFTDSYNFFGSVMECTNISCGYQHAHTSSEMLDHVWLEKMVEACMNYDWSSLPAVRDPYAYDPYGYFQDYGGLGLGKRGKSFGFGGFSKPNTRGAVEKLSSLIARNPHEAVEFVEECGVYIESFDEQPSLTKMEKVTVCEAAPGEIAKELADFGYLPTDFESFLKYLP